MTFIGPAALVLFNISLVRLTRSYPALEYLFVSVHVCVCIVSVKQSVSTLKQEFIHNQRKINNGEDFPRYFLTEILPYLASCCAALSSKHCLYAYPLLIIERRRL